MEWIRRSLPQRPVKGSSLSVGQLLSAFGEGLSSPEIAAGAAIPRSVIHAALGELAARLNLPPKRPE